MSLANLMTMAEVAASRVGKPILKHADGLPQPLARKARKKSQEQLGKDFRAAVWARDKGRSRATGRKLVKSGTSDWAKLGEVDHSVPRSLAPDRLYDVGNGILLSKEENRLRKVVCAEAPEFKRFDYAGDDDRSKPQSFTWRDKMGCVTKQHTEGARTT